MPPAGVPPSEKSYTRSCCPHNRNTTNTFNFGGTLHALENRSCIPAECQGLATPFENKLAQTQLEDEFEDLQSREFGYFSTYARLRPFLRLAPIGGPTAKIDKSLTSATGQTAPSSFASVDARHSLIRRSASSTSDAFNTCLAERCRAKHV